MTDKDAILFNLRRSGAMIGTFTSDLSEADLHHRVVPAANPASWILGHLVLIDRNLLKLLGVGEENMPRLPSAEFGKAYARDEHAPKLAGYPDAAALPALFQQHRDALIGAVEATDESRFAEPLEKPTRIANTLGEMLLFMGLHVAMHVGQISTIRRTLGRPPLV